MHLATERNMIQVVEMLLGCQGDPTLKNKAGFTCMHIAAREGHLNLVKLFLSKSVDPSIRDNYGFSASYWAR